VPSALCHGLCILWKVGGIECMFYIMIRWTFLTFRRFPARLSEQSGDPASAGLQGTSNTWRL